MSNQPQKTPADSRMEKLARHDQWIERIFRRILHLIEQIIAVVTILVLVVSLVLDLYQIFAGGLANVDVNLYLHNILTIVVGLEFVRMLIDTTPANVLEVLTLAITRHVILSHDDPWSNLACIACIAGLFAIRRFLIRRHELQEEMVETE
ncbi:MAG: phosphate-starvation-inducible PsiE family protein [Faecousia sp.]